MGQSKAASDAFIRAFQLGFAGEQRNRGRKEDIKFNTDKYLFEEAADRKKWVEKVDAERAEQKEANRVKKADNTVIDDLLSGKIKEPDIPGSVNSMTDAGIKRYQAIKTATKKPTPKITTLGTREVVSKSGHINKITAYSDGTQRVDETLRLPSKDGESKTDPNRDLTKEFGKYRKYAFELDQMQKGIKQVERDIISQPQEKNPYYRKDGYWGIDAPLKEGMDPEFIPELPGKLQDAYDKHYEYRKFYQQEIEQNLFTDDLFAITKGMNTKESSKQKAQAVYQQYLDGKNDLTENEIVALSLWYKFKFGEYLNWQEMTSSEK